MKKNKPNDNLEQFFQKGLNDNPSQPGSTNWDLPSHAVWEGIADQLPAPKQPVRRPLRRHLWAIAATILLLMVAGIAIYSHHKISTLEQQLARQADQLNQLPDEIKQHPTEKALKESTILLPDLETPSSEPPHDTNEKATNQQQKTTTINNSTTKSTNKPESKNIPNSSQKTPTPTTKPTQQLEKSKPTKTNKISPQEKQLMKENKGQKSPQALNGSKSKPLVGQKAFPFEKEATSTFVLAPTQTHPLLSVPGPKAKGQLRHTDPIPLPQKKKWYAGIWAGPAFTKAIAKTKSGEPINKNIDNKYAFTAGLRLGWQISDRWSLESGLGWMQQTSRRHHDLSFRYDPAAETTTADGRLETTYSTELRTSYGDVPIDVPFSRRPDQTIPNGTRVGMEIKDEMTNTHLQIPLSVRYTLLDGGKFALSSSVGMVLSHLQKHRRSFDLAQRSPHPNLRPERTRIHTMHPSLKKNRLDMGAGLQNRVSAYQNHRSLSGTTI